MGKTVSGIYQYRQRYYFERANISKLKFLLTLPIFPVRGKMKTIVIRSGLCRIRHNRRTLSYTFFFSFSFDTASIASTRLN